MYIFNTITIRPKLPEKIERLEEISNNLWWSWNIEFLQLLREIDKEVWEACEKNPVKFLKNVPQDKLERAAENEDFVRRYNEVVSNYDSYMNSKNTYFNKHFPSNTNDIIAYFSAEYGLDETIPIYSGGLGILSGDHLKSSSDLGLPLIGVGLLYKEGYFNQRITAKGEQISEYQEVDITNMPVYPVKNENGEDTIITVQIEGKDILVKVWEIQVGRIKLYLLDTDLMENPKEYQGLTKKLYGGGQETRIAQEIVLGIGGVRALKAMGIEPKLYHMNEGHSSFLVIELIKDIMKEKQVSFDVAKEIAFAMLAFTTHTPVPAGNDIFDVELVSKYLVDKWKEIGLSKEEFLKMGMTPNDTLNNRFNMAVLALKYSGKKNGVSKLHGKVSREIFSEVWPNTFDDESPITHVTNGIHTCTWTSAQLKETFNEYFPPYWQERIQDHNVWKAVDDIPDERLWDIHKKRKLSMQEEVRRNIKQRFISSGVSYGEVTELLKYLNPNVLTIGFARRFATYKRAALIFKDIERLTQILNDENRPVQIVFAGKAHPADGAGQDVIKYIHEVSLMPQFKGKIFLLENYNIAVSRYLISGVDVWLNNPRRPMEASGTSGEKTALNGIPNFSVSDGWWEEGYNGENGWIIGSTQNYDVQEEQDLADSNSLYHVLESDIIPKFYERDEQNIPRKWLKVMKNSIKSIGPEYSTSRMIIDYLDVIYMPLVNLYKNEFTNLENVFQYLDWKKNVYKNWDKIKIEQRDNIDKATLDAGQELRVSVKVNFGNIDPENAQVQAYIIRMNEQNDLDLETVINLTKSTEEGHWNIYEGDINLVEGGNFAYTFRVIPKHRMLLDPANMDLYKWLKK